MEQYDSENAIDLQACFFKHGRFIERSLLASLVCPPWLNKSWWRSRRGRLLGLGRLIKRRRAESARNGREVPRSSVSFRG